MVAAPIRWGPNRIDLPQRAASPIIPLSSAIICTHAHTHSRTRTLMAACRPLAGNGRCRKTAGAGGEEAEAAVIGAGDVERRAKKSPGEDRRGQTRRNVQPADSSFLPCRAGPADGFGLKAGIRGGPCRTRRRRRSGAKGPVVPSSPRPPPSPAAAFSCSPSFPRHPPCPPPIALLPSPAVAFSSLPSFPHPPPCPPPLACGCLLLHARKLPFPPRHQDLTY